MEKTLVFEMQSESDPSIFYGIYLGSDDRFSCDCKSYFYTSQKTENFRCKHIKQFLSVQEVRDL